MKRIRTISITCTVAFVASLLLARVHALGQSAFGASGTQARSPDQPVVEGDPTRGKDIFEKDCTGCHALTQDREGPRLQGVYGRTSGEVAGFTYSPELKKAQIVWNEMTLEQWLADPDALVPGNNMEFHVTKQQDRRDLIVFLRQNPHD